MAGKNLRVVRELKAARSHVSGDAVRLQQVLWNLLRNAVKFTPPGGQIVLRSENVDGLFRISVADTGIGIDAEAIGKIFTAFEQAERFITQRFGGLGLGLTISKRLVELHNGTLTAYSEGRDRGATFTVTLPVVPAPSYEPLPGSAPGAAGADATRRPAGRSLRILLVEDHDDTRRSMARLLGARHTVRDVGSVAGALAIAAAGEAFDLVISDLGLPDGSGLDLMRVLRERYGLRGICLSGFGMEDDIARSADAGFRHHLTKPVDLHKLEQVIQAIDRG
jgi:CheY-like chemotaxis protein/anti-sigma regulatory factor (Ser/Thr protein kinase)